MNEQAIEEAAQSIAEQIIAAARNSGDDPIAWVTGNAYMPPLRSFPEAEAIYQSSDVEEAEDWQYLSRLVDTKVEDAQVALECPDYDNALYAVDLRRFEFSGNEDAETLQEDWIKKGA